MLTSKRTQARLHLPQLIRLKRKSARRPMSAVFAQQVITKLQCLKYIELRNAPRRAANLFFSLVLIRTNEHRHAVALY